MTTIQDILNTDLNNIEEVQLDSRGRATIGAMHANKRATIAVINLEDTKPRRKDQ